MSNDAKCILCGGVEFQELEHEYYDVTPTGKLQLMSDTLKLIECKNCGLIQQQKLPFTSLPEYKKYYQIYPPVKTKYTIKDYEHDYKLAGNRFKQYNVEGRVLDIGSGSGAFVDVCRENEVEAYGCEIIKYHYKKSNKYIYYGCFEEIHFPTDYFNTITCHDVLEHVYDPFVFMQELFRTLNQDGKCYIDFPRFFGDEGKHHWKKEHIWYFGQPQLKQLLELIGFKNIDITHPIKSKILIYAEKPKQERPKIAFPPGLGDAYWVLVKLQSILKKRNIDLPNIFTLCPPDKKYKTDIRAMDFINMMPFVKASYEVIPLTEMNELVKEAYVKCGTTVFENVMDADYFISYNGILESGFTMEECDEFECDWNLPRFISLYEEEYKRESEKRWGKYIVFHFCFQGSFKFWMDEFSVVKLTSSVCKIIDKTGFTPVFVGGAWDEEDKLLVNMTKQIPEAVNLIGKTNLEELFGLLRGSQMVIAYPSGLSLVGVMLGKKTLMLWNDWHRYGFHWNTSPLAAKNNIYFIENTRYLTEDIFVQKVLDIVNGVPNLEDEYCERMYNYEQLQAVDQLNMLNIEAESRVLILDSKAGAMVDECRRRGIEAYGWEPQEHDYEVDNRHIYRRQLEEIHFPTDYFDWVVCNESFGYRKEPLEYIKEIFRIVKQNGNVYINFSELRHMNVWFYKVNELKDELLKVGFNIVKTKKSDVGTEFYLTKPEQNRVKIIVPPGIGDSYWSLVKLESFLEKNNLKSPVDIYVGSPKEKVYYTHKRAFGYLKMISFLNSTGIVIDERTKGAGNIRQVWKEAYFEEGRSIFKVAGGYFISHNGHLRVGEELEEIDEYSCNWFLPRFISIQEEEFRKNCIHEYGKYIVIYFAFQGSNRRFFDYYTIQDIAWVLNKIIKKTKLSPVFAGAVWDLEDAKLRELKDLIPNHVDLTGKTNVTELFGLLRGASAVVGAPSGLSIMAAVEGVKTILLWHSYFTTRGINRKFAWNVFPPQVRRKNYFAEYAEDITKEGFVARAISVITEAPFVKQKEYYRTTKSFVRDLEDVQEPIISVRSIEDIKKTVRVSKTTVVCVLKSGSDFNIDYVLKLKNMVNRNTTIPHRFLCLTDMDLVSYICDVEKLQNNYDGWWSKIELFRKGLDGGVIYFDLDTIILNNIDDILSLDVDFAALRPWNSKNRRLGMMASGVMAWNNNGGDRYSYIYNEFDYESVGQYRGGDQEYITKKLIEHEERFRPLQKLVSGIYSFKRNCIDGTLPSNARIVCFHGNPRPKDLLRLNWVQNNWR